MFDQTTEDFCKSHYNPLKYNAKGRFVGYWHQINEVILGNPNSVLEIGIGNRFVSSELERIGFQVTSIDILKSFHPSVKGSILQLPVKDSAFDTCLCCEVLEHLPFENLRVCLQELRRVSKSNIIVSIPDASWYFYLKTIVPFHFPLLAIDSVPKLFHKDRAFDGIHYWEIGRRNYSLQKILKEFKCADLKVLRTFRVIEDPFSRFFILKK